MSMFAASWFGLIKKTLIVISILVGLYLFTFVVSRMVIDSLFRGIASSKATGLSSLGFSSYTPADNLMTSNGKNVVRAVTVSLEAPSFDDAESRVEDITRQSGGFLEEFKVHRQSDASPWLEAKLRLPVRSMDTALAALRSLGVVRQETEASEDTNAERDTLNGQIEAKRDEFDRLNEIVQHRKGSLPDTVQAEEKLSERRTELVDLEKQLKKVGARVEYALVELQITEQYRARLDWRAAGFLSDLRNSFVEGLAASLASFGIVLGFLLHYGLVTFLWLGALYWPSRSLWRRHHKPALPIPTSAA